MDSYLGHSTNQKNGHHIYIIHEILLQELALDYITISSSLVSCFWAMHGYLLSLAIQYPPFVDIKYIKHYISVYLSQTHSTLNDNINISLCLDPVTLLPPIFISICVYKYIQVCICLLILLSKKSQTLKNIC